MMPVQSLRVLALTHQRVETLAHAQDMWLEPQMHIGEVMARFDRAQSDELGVLDPDRRILGMLTANFVR